MNRNNLAASLAFCASLVLNGCAGAGGTTADTARPQKAAANTAPAPSAVPASPPTSAGNAAPAATVGGGNKVKAAQAPRPQISSGGNDFFLFTQARAALGADAELKGAYPVVEVKEGVVTLTGTVATAAQKSRAEQLARGVGGVKAVRNRLRVSAGSQEHSTERRSS